MKIKMQREDVEEKLIFSPWDVAFFGADLDDRCNSGIHFSQSNSTKAYSLEYYQDKFEFSLNNDITIGIDDLGPLHDCIKDKKVLLEATSLGFVEMLIIAKIASEVGVQKLSFLYIEPKSYRKRGNYSIFERRDFELSGEVPGYQSIPGFSYILSDDKRQNIIFFLGYEAARLDRAFEDYQMIRPELCSLIFGVPAFNAGWENDSFANNISILKDRKISGEIHYVSASNPYVAYLKLIEIRQGIDETEQIFISPIGTTPEGIGAILFTIQHPNIGILYDHPIKLAKRTGKIACYHLFDVNLDI